MRLISVPMYVTVSIIGINHQPEDVQLLHLIAFRFFSLELAVHVYHLQWPACLATMRGSRKFSSTSAFDVTVRVTSQVNKHEPKFSGFHFLIPAN